MVYSAYCQLIGDANKQKRLEWARQHWDVDFENVLWTDECTVQLENHGLMMDNDPKHTSHPVADYLRDQNINWWKTPAESPD